MLINICLILLLFLSNAHVPPNPYVTYSAADSHHLCRTQVLKSTSKPLYGIINNQLN